MDWRPVLAQLLAHAERMRPMMRDVSVLLTQAMAAAVGAVRRGAGHAARHRPRTYPYVTSSNASSACPAPASAFHRAPSNACSAWSRPTPPRRRRTAADRADRRDGQRLRDSGNEYGAVTGRPRRCGWYDAVAVRYGVRINGLDALALTKARRARRLEQIDICTSYTIGGRRSPTSQATWTAVGVQPVYESMPGWTAPTAGVRTFTSCGGGAQVHRAPGRGDRRPRRDRLHRLGARRHDHPRDVLKLW